MPHPWWRQAAPPEQRHPRRAGDGHEAGGARPGQLARLRSHAAADQECTEFVGHHPEPSLRQAGADLVVRSLEEVTVAQVEQLVRGKHQP